MVPSISDLLLAYRQAKTTLFFEHRGYGLLALAKFEAKLSRNLKAVSDHFKKYGPGFAGLPLGDVYVIPKRLQLANTRREGPIQIGGTSPLGERLGVEVQLRLSPSPEFAIAEVLYLWKFGPALDTMLSSAALGNRLDLREGGRVRRTGRWLFEYWRPKYQRFRTEPLDAARRALQLGEVAVVSADFASFYDSVAPDFLVSKNFVEELSRRNQETFDPEEYAATTCTLLRAYQSYREVAARLTGLPWTTGIPIGAMTSRIVANVALVNLDTAIVAQPHVTSYHRYVDDLVIVGRPISDPGSSLDEALASFLPHLSVEGDALRFDGDALGRPGCEFQLSRPKTRVHLLSGVQGGDFVAAIARDFRAIVSERRAFLDTSLLAEDAAARFIRAGNGESGVLRVLRDADRTKLEHFGMGNVVRTLERVSALAEPEGARKAAAQTLERLGRFLDGEHDWVEALDLAFRLLRLTADLRDPEAFQRIYEGMNAGWGTSKRLRSSAGRLFHRGRAIRSRRAWTSMRDHLHARRVEAICTALRLPAKLESLEAWPVGPVVEGNRKLGSRGLLRRAQLLAAADLRARDREDDGLESHKTGGGLPAGIEEALADRFLKIKEFVSLCRKLGDDVWVMPAHQLFLCTRPPSYFDIARRWLYQVETRGFTPDVFNDLLRIVNAVRGTEYWNPLGAVHDRQTVALNLGEPPDEAQPSARLILANLVVSEAAFEAASNRTEERARNRPHVGVQRLRALADVLDKAVRAARRARMSSGPESLLVLPELSVPRPWFRSIGNYIAATGEIGLVVGLEYLHAKVRPQVLNQVFAVLPGPYQSVVTWPWTKRRPAREEAKRLSERKPPLSFPPALGFRRRTVVHCRFGRLSVLVCSELIEGRRIADLLGRVELILAPSWNRDTASYDHVLRSVALQLHAVVAIANNGYYSDCRVLAPYQARWRRDLCRLIERGVDDIVVVDVPIGSLQEFHFRGGAAPLHVVTDEGGGEWQALPPDFP